MGIKPHPTKPNHWIIEVTAGHKRVKSAFVGTEEQAHQMYKELLRQALREAKK